jgi:hypothetical protein
MVVSYMAVEWIFYLFISFSELFLDLELSLDLDFLDLELSF